MFNENDNEDEPAVAMITTLRGNNYDAKNIPGFLRKRLIDSGEISINTFVKADNLPGHKLKAMRDRFRKNNPNLGPQAPVSDAIDFDTLEVGSMVQFKKYVTEVEKINANEKKVYISKGDGKKAWVAVSKLKAVVVTNEEE